MRLGLKRKCEVRLGPKGNEKLTLLPHAVKESLGKNKDQQSNHMFFIAAFQSLGLLLFFILLMIRAQRCSTAVSNETKSNPFPFQFANPE